MVTLAVNETAYYEEGYDSDGQQGTLKNSQYERLDTCGLEFSNYIHSKM